jgi:ribosomal protein S18
MSGATNHREDPREFQHLWCVGTREDGEPCGSRAMRGSDFCFWHDPAKEEERREEFARREQLAGVPILSAAMSLDTVADVEELLCQVAMYLATGGRIEPRRATALTAVADRLLRAIRIKELQAELSAAKQEIEQLQRRCQEYEQALKGSGSLGVEGIGENGASQRATET